MGSSSKYAVWLDASDGRQIPIVGSCFFGRSPACEVVIADQRASRQHALVHAQEREHWLIDLGSANGTYLNGRRIAQPARLTEGDRLEIAGASFVFRRPQPSDLPAVDAAGKPTIFEIRTLQCWLLVADIESSSQLHQKLPAAEVLGLTGKWLASCRKILHDQQGTVNKFLGDGFLAYWQAAAETPAAVGATLLALKEIQKNSTPPFRMALHFGEVNLGGAVSVGDEPLTGNAVNFVFRMEKLAGQLGTGGLASQPAFDQLKRSLSAKSLGAHPLAGFPGEFQFYSF